MQQGIVATMRIVEGKGAAFEALFREIQAAVKANEPGNLVYELFRSKTEENCYKVMEIYKDQAALDAHRQNDGVKALAPRLAEFKASPTEAEYFDGI